MNAKKSSILLSSGLALVLLVGCNEEGEVAQTTEVQRTVAAKQPREVCTEETVTRQKPAKDQDRVIGTVTGAVVGGVIGHEVGGKGDSQDVATVGGAVVGGIAGNKVQKSMQKNNTEQVTERVCRTVYE